MNSSVFRSNGTRMEGGCCVAVLEESSTWTVLQQRSCDDRSGLFLWLEQRDHHAQPSAGDDGQRYRRPADTWLVDRPGTVRLGARLFRQLNTSIDSLKSTRCRIGSQFYSMKNLLLCNHAYLKRLYIPPTSKQKLPKYTYNWKVSL